MPDGPGELLKISLSAAVPLWIMEFKNRPWPEIAKIAADAAQFIAEHGDWVLYGGPKKGRTAEAFNAVAKGLAALSFVPGGVKFMGMHFEARHGEGEAAVGTTRPVNLTFERGTLGRFILRNRLALEWSPASGNPDNPWTAFPYHYLVTLRSPERTFTVNFSSGTEREPVLEEVLEALGRNALDVERSGGDVGSYAALTGADPADPDVGRELRASEAEAAGLRVFLGPDAYGEILATVEGSAGGASLGAAEPPEEEWCPADITFAGGTLGRIVLLRGLELEWVTQRRDPAVVRTVVRDRWHRSLVTDVLVGRDDPKPSVEEVLTVVGLEVLEGPDPFAKIWERRMTQAELRLRAFL